MTKCLIAVNHLNHFFQGLLLIMMGKIIYYFLLKYLDSQRKPELKKLMRGIVI